MEKSFILLLILCAAGLLSACRPAADVSSGSPSASSAPNPYDACSSAYEGTQGESRESQEIVVYTKGLPTAVEPGSRQAEDIMLAVAALCRGAGQVVPLAIPEAPDGPEAAGPIGEAKNSSALEISYGQDVTLSFHLETEGGVQAQSLTFEKILIAPEQQLVFLYADGGYGNGPIRFYAEEDFAAVRALLENF